MSLTVRDARPADAEAVRKVHYDSIVGLGPTAYDPEQVDAWARGCDSADYEAAITSDDGPFVVAVGRDVETAELEADGLEADSGGSAVPPSDPDPAASTAVASGANVAQNGARLVGFGSLSFDPPEEYEASPDAEVTGVYVHPSVAGRGVGTAILEELEGRARAADVRALGLSASLNAVAFYEAHGYERVREYGHEFSSHEDSGVEGTVVEMVREV